MALPASNLSHADSFADDLVVPDRTSLRVGGIHPMQHLLGASVLAHLPAGRAAVLEGRSFFPDLIAAPFRQGLHAAFDFAIGACLLASAASWTSGRRYVHVEDGADPREDGATSQAVAEGVVM